MQCESERVRQLPKEGHRVCLSFTQESKTLQGPFRKFGDFGGGRKGWGFQTNWFWRGEGISKEQFEVNFWPMMGPDML